MSTTLHVATEVYPTGGHTRILAKWVRHDTSSNHVVVLTCQRFAVPVFFEREISEAGGTLVCLTPSESHVVRAAALRHISTSCDRIVLHSHPDDPVPVLAFAPPGGPPVAMFNHAHFDFCLCPSVSDLMLNTFDYFKTISQQHRFARQTDLLTVVSGIAPVTRDPIDKAAARISLGFDRSSCLVLTGGHERYFTPIAGYDFFRTAQRLLAANPKMQLLVMGIRSESSLVPLELKTEPRCHLLGPVIDPVPYYRAADLCLESFPMPSLGIVAEAIAQGEAFPVPVYGTEGILRVSQVPLLKYRYRPLDEEDYVAYVSELSADLAGAREEARLARLSLQRIEQEWSARLEAINHAVDRLKHASEELPSTARIDSDDSRILADLSPLDVGEGIDQVLPFGTAVKAWIHAAWQGHLSPRRALNGVGARVMTGLKRL